MVELGPAIRSNTSLRTKSFYPVPSHHHPTTLITDDDHALADQEYCDVVLVENFEASQRAMGLSEAEVGERTSKMLGRFLERKWNHEGSEGRVVMASGRVQRLPGCGNVRAGEWEAWARE